MDGRWCICDDHSEKSEDICIACMFIMGSCRLFKVRAESISNPNSIPGMNPDDYSIKWRREYKLYCVICDMCCEKLKIVDKKSWERPYESYETKQ
jgi:hypothetical protein